MIDVADFVTHCDLTLARLQAIDPKSPWFVAGTGEFGGEYERVTIWLEQLANEATEVSAPNAPPPIPSETYAHAMTTSRARPAAVEYVRQLRRWAASLVAPAIDQEAKSSAVNPFKKKDVSGRMLEKMQNDKECHGWTAKKWAEFLKCSPASVVATSTWKKLALERARLRAERARDRHGRGTGRKRELT